MSWRSSTGTRVRGSDTSLDIIMNRQVVALFSIALGATSTAGPSSWKEDHICGASLSGSAGLRGVPVLRRVLIWAIIRSGRL